MNNYELSKLKRSAIAKAWLAEKLRISKGEGTNDWSPIQQDDILNYNCATGFVGQFLTDDTEESKMKVQFVEMSIDFLSAHDIRQNNRKSGVIDTNRCIVTPSTTLPTVKLTEPSYLGYFDTHRSMFVGQDMGFGLKVSATNSQADQKGNNSRFGLKSTDSPDSTDKTDPIRDRMKKFGF